MEEKKKRNEIVRIIEINVAQQGMVERPSIIIKEETKIEKEKKDIEAS